MVSKHKCNKPSCARCFAAKKEAAHTPKKDFGHTEKQRFDNE